jgi:hypothetical protein
MAFEAAPAELEVVPTGDGVRMSLLPYMPKFGKPLRRGATTGGVSWGASCGLPDVVPGEVVLGTIALVVVLGTGWVVLGALQESRRKRTRLQLCVQPRALELRWNGGEPGERTERIELAHIGRVDVVEAGYQRPHVMAQVLDREPLAIPMERNSLEAAQWLARELAKASSTARQQRGSVADIPPALRRQAAVQGAPQGAPQGEPQGEIE